MYGDVQVWQDGGPPIVPSCVLRSWRAAAPGALEKVAEVGDGHRARIVRGTLHDLARHRVELVARQAELAQARRSLQTLHELENREDGVRVLECVGDSRSSGEDLNSAVRQFSFLAEQAKLAH